MTLDKAMSMESAKANHFSPVSPKDPTDSAEPKRGQKDPRGQSKNLNALINVRDFGLQDEVIKIFESKIYANNTEIITDLEIYKFMSRNEILQRLKFKFPDLVLENISNVNRKEEFLTTEGRYGILIDYVDNKTVRVIKSVFQTLDQTNLELDLKQFKNIDVINITDVNFRELSEYGYKPKYDPMILFKRILLEVIKLNGTDIHFGVIHRNMKAEYPIQYRVNGDLYDLDLFTLDREMNRSIISNLVETKTSANSLDLSLPDGITANSSDILENGNVELRIAANKVKDGLQCVIRIQERKTFSYTIDSLGFSKEAQDFLMWLSRKRSGITLITGAIRTGKNTTAFALANEMVKYPIKMIDYSSPIEVLMPFNQVDYLADENNLLACVRLAKKQDVNVAFLNEIPSKEVAFAVKDLVNSSIHVITTIHMDRIWHLPYKLNEYYGSSYKDVISQINGVMNQKMFDVMCPHCKELVPTSSITDLAKKDFLEERGVQNVWITKGCERCTSEMQKKVGSIPGANQPYVEFLRFDDKLKSRLLACAYAWQMEEIIKEVVREKGNTLEDTMIDGIKRGVLDYNTLDHIL